jgi:hypothetical protein
VFPLHLFSLPVCIWVQYLFSPNPKSLSESGKSANLSGLCDDLDVAAWYGPSDRDMQDCSVGYRSICRIFNG